MKKETINTFEGGMIKDLHPLTTPNNVLTDALNATLITYNGNENILLNDMGNALLLHAKLPVGYVPVGMKEHGGIIYVAAYNPKTEKGLVGSFPSPQLLWEGSGWSVNAPDHNIDNVSISNSNFYDGNKIINEVVKTKLFYSNAGTRVFHPGDKFVIKIDSKAVLQGYINLGYISVLLGVVKSDGGIEIIRTWSKDNNDGSFLYSGDDAPSSLLSNSTYCLVFDASSSGELILIITLHTLDSFNIIKKYSINSNDYILVEFTGEATRNGAQYKSTDSATFFRIIEEGNINAPGEVQKITKTSSSKYNSLSSLGDTTVSIYPTVPFGIIDRMKKTIKVNFDKIRKNQDDFSEWRFFVTNTYVKIGWAYDFYNLDGSKEIEYIRMYFHKLENGYKRDDPETRVYTFLKEYYSGNFEDYISISDTGLKYKSIYIVEIVKKFKSDNDEQIICFKMLYLSKLYNSMYNTFFDNKSIGIEGTRSNSASGEYQCLNDMKIGLSINAELQTKLTSAKAKVKIPGNDSFGDEVGVEELNSDTYIKPIDLNELTTLLGGNSNKYFITNVLNTYDCTLKMIGSLTDVDEEIIGTPGLNEYSLIDAVLDRVSAKGSGYTATIESPEWLKSTSSFTPPTLNNIHTCECPALTTTLSNGTKSTLFVIKDDRYIVGSMSELLTTTYDSKGLVPLYSPNDSPERKNKVAPYWKQEQLICIAGEGDDRKTMHYNSTVSGYGTTIDGPDAQGGCDNGGLLTASSYMNNPMTNLFAGVRGDNAEIEFRRLKKQSAKSNLDLEDDESDFSLNGEVIVDQDDDYLIACWKFTDGNSKFVNLITRKKVLDQSGRVKNSLDAWPRLDVMMRCILSQLFVVDKISKSITYITPNPQYYAWESASTKGSFTMNYNTTDAPTYDDIMCSPGTNKTLTSYLTDENKWNYYGEKIHISKGDFDLVNLIPKVSLELPFNSEHDITFEFTLPDLYDLDTILGNYLGISYVLKTNDGENLNIKSIYSIDTSKTAQNTLACDNSEGLKPMTDGAFKWKYTPECKVVDNNLTIYRWNNLNTLTFKEFASHFTTKASLEGWVDVGDELNEVLAITGTETDGYWTDGGSKEVAPTMNYKTLYSTELSLYKDSLEPVTPGL